MNKIKLFSISTAIAISASAFAQAEATPDQSSSEVTEDGTIYLAPLFEYPSAPEEITDFNEKCGWLVDNFWNQLDVKSTQPVDQARLNDAFGVYAVACQYAPKEKAEASAEKLIKSLQKNPTLLLQMIKAAEEKLYGPRADIWIDELYVKFLRAGIANKKIPKTRKVRMESQLKQLEGSMIGGSPAMFEFTRANGEPARYFPMATPTILIFGDPDCGDCRQSRLRMEVNVAFNRAVTDGKINVLYIIPDAESGWENKVTDFPRNWTVGASDTVAELYDMRATPQIYLIGSDGKILGKNLSTQQAMAQALAAIGQ